MDDERRQFQRLNLSRPLDGWFGDYGVRIVDLSATGAQIEHDEEIPADARALLRFWWRNEEVEITAQIARAHDSRSGVRFCEESEAIRNMLATSATELLRAQEANAMGERERNVIDGDTTITAAARSHITGYVTWILGSGGWDHRSSLIADQPPDGFTVAAGEPEEQVELLRRTYESGDADARKLTRLFAELSVAKS